MDTKTYSWWVLAVANKGTEYQWVKRYIGRDNELECLRRLATQMSEGEYSQSAIGIFRNSRSTHWTERKPQFVYNGHVLAQVATPRKMLGGLINSLESDWF